MSQAPGLESQSIPEIAPTFRLQWEEVQNCYVVLYPEGMVKLSQTAGEIMKRVDGKTNIADIVKQLEQAFQSQGLMDDVLKFLRDAHENGWVRPKG